MAWGLIKILGQYTLMKFIPNDLYGKYGKNESDQQQKSWALVTGATDGIGLALCKVLAKDYGFNILMVSRSADKLEEKKMEILQYCDRKVNVQFETQDFSKISSI